MDSLIPARRIDRVHRTLELGGDGQVDRKAVVIPPGNWELFDPFLLMFEDWFSTPGFDWHPHRGIETVTTVLDGALEHGDSRGNAGVLGPGDVQWMTAGSGIVHRELAYRDEHVHTLQLWVNLPASHKMVDSRYQDFTPATMTVVEDRGSRIDVVAGHVGEHRGPADTHRPMTALQGVVEPGRSLRAVLPGDHRAFLYLLAGSLLAGDHGEALTAGDVAWSDPTGSGDSVLELVAPEADEPARFLLYSGRPLGEPVVARGPFVMNTADEILEAFTDFRAGRFGPIPALARRG